MTQILSSLQDINTEIDEAPRLVVFVSEDAITTAYIVADEKLRIPIPEPTVERVIGGLLCAYYCWHRTFPAAYAGILEFMAYRVFGLVMKKNSGAAKLVRKLENIKK